MRLRLSGPLDLRDRHHDGDSADNLRVVWPSSGDEVERLRSAAIAKAEPVYRSRLRPTAVTTSSETFVTAKPTDVLSSNL